jgi:hypothetical protein
LALFVMETSCVLRVITYLFCFFLT